MPVKYELPITQTSTGVAVSCAFVIGLIASSITDVGRNSLFGNLLKLIHLGSFSTWFGVQIWVTFVAGLTMYRYLPRHMFGFIQGKLFPKYFLLGTILSAASTISFIILNPFNSWKGQQYIQGCALFIGVIVTMINMLYFEPQTSLCTVKKHKYEKEKSAGNNPGYLEEDKVKELRMIEEYAKLEKRFILLHTLATISNLISLAVQTIHLWYLSRHLQSV